MAFPVNLIVQTTVNMSLLSEMLDMVPGFRVAGCATDRGAAVRWLAYGRREVGAFVLDAAMLDPDGALVSLCREASPGAKLIALANSMFNRFDKEILSKGFDAVFSTGDPGALLDYLRLAVRVN